MRYKRLWCVSFSERLFAFPTTQDATGRDLGGFRRVLAVAENSGWVAPVLSF